MNTIYINSGVIDTTAFGRFSSLNKNEKWTILLSDKVSTFSQETKKSLINNLLISQGIGSSTIETIDHKEISSKTANELAENLYLFSTDYMKNDIKDAQDAEKISCYERSLANIIGRYHWSVDNFPENSDHFIAELAKYLQVTIDSNLVQEYLNHAGIKKESLEYISNLKPTRLKTIDNIITKQENNETYLLIGERKDYPKGPALLGGFIDYKPERDSESDLVIAKKLGLNDLSLVTGIREGIEEASGVDPDNIDIEYEIRTTSTKFPAKSRGFLLIGTEKSSKFSVAIDILQAPIDYIEDPKDFKQIPADARGPVSNRARHMKIVSGAPKGSDDIESVKWVNVNELDTIDFAMPHHPLMIKQLLGKGLGNGDSESSEY